MRPLILMTLLLALMLSPGTASAKFRSAFGITLQRCIVNVNASHTQTDGINVVYFNSHETPATEVDFLVHYRGATYTLTDRGSFTHYAQINHNLTDALVGHVWQGPKPELCVPGRVLFANGKILM